MSSGSSTVMSGADSISQASDAAARLPQPVVDSGPVTDVPTSLTATPLAAPSSISFRCPRCDFILPTAAAAMRAAAVHEHEDWHSACDLQLQLCTAAEAASTGPSGKLQAKRPRQLLINSTDEYGHLQKRQMKMDYFAVSAPESR